MFKKHSGFIPLLAALILLVAAAVTVTGYYFIKVAQEQKIGSGGEEEDTTPPAGSPILHCFVFDEPGKYYLANDIDAVETCMRIKADNVILDCNGRSITSKTGWGITTGSADNITIKNCVVKNSQSGIHLYYTENSLIQGNTVINSTSSDFLCSESSNNTDGGGNVCGSNPNCPWLTCLSPE